MPSGMFFALWIQAALDEAKAKAKGMQRELEEVHRNLATMQSILGVRRLLLHNYDAALLSKLSAACFSMR